MLLIVIVFTTLACWLIPKIFAVAKRGFAAIRAWFRGQPNPQVMPPSGATTPSPQ